MPIEVELPDGTIAEFPEGMDQAEIQRVLSQQYQQGAPEIAQEPQEAGDNMLVRALGGVGDVGRSIGEGVVRGAAQRSLGLMQLGADALEQTGLGGETLSDFQQSAKNVATRLRKSGEGTGVSGFVGEALGDPATYVLGGIAKGRQPFNLAAKGFGGGAAISATSPLEEGQSRTGNMLAGGVAGGITLPASVVASDAIQKAASYFAQKLTGKAPALATSEYLDDVARPFYDEVDRAKGAINPAKSSQAISNVYNIVKPRSQAQANAIKDDVAFRMYADHFAPLLGKPLTLRDVDYIDGRLQTAISQNLKDKQAVSQLTRMRQALNDLANNAKPGDFIGGSEGFRAWKQGDKVFAAARAMKSLENIIENARSTQQPATYITDQVRILLRNKRTSRAFTEQEKKYLRQALDIGDIEDVVRVGGSRLNQIAATASGGLQAGIVTGAASNVIREAGIKAKEAAVRKAQQAITSRVLGTPMPKLQIGASPTAAGIGAGATVGATKEATRPVDINVEPAQNVPLSDIEPEPQPVGNGAAADQFIKQNEGLRLSTYVDTTGNPTIGYGFNFNSGIAPKVWKAAGIKTPIADVRSGKAGITQQDAESLYRASFNIAKNDARSFYGSGFDQLSQPQQIALADLSYQMGLPNLKKFVGLRKALQRGDKNGIIRAISQSDYGKKYKNRSNQVIERLISI